MPAVAVEPAQLGRRPGVDGDVVAQPVRQRARRTGRRCPTAAATRASCRPSASSATSRPGPGVVRRSRASSRAQLERATGERPPRTRRGTGRTARAPTGPSPSRRSCRRSRRCGPPPGCEVHAEVALDPRRPAESRTSPSAAAQVQHLRPAGGGQQARQQPLEAAAPRSSARTRSLPERRVGARGASRSRIASGKLRPGPRVPEGLVPRRVRNPKAPPASIGACAARAFSVAAGRRAAWPAAAARATGSRPPPSPLSSPPLSRAPAGRVVPAGPQARGPGVRPAHAGCWPWG